MRAILTLGIIILATVANAQTQTNPPPPSQSAPSIAPTTNKLAPVGHRQPTARDVPSSNPSTQTVSPLDRAVNKGLKICRGC